MFKTLIIKDIPETRQFPTVFIRFQPDYYQALLKKQDAVLRAVEKKMPGVHLKWSDELVSPETEIHTKLYGRVHVDSGVDLFISIPHYLPSERVKGLDYAITQVLEQLDKAIANTTS